MSANDTPQLPPVLTTPLPDDPVRRMTRLAHDLAYGAIGETWSPQFTYTSKSGSNFDFEPTYHGIGAFYAYRHALWGGRVPHPKLLESLGHLRISDARQFSTQYILTEQAFALLRQPAMIRLVFISYRRVTSSTMAMMLWAYLQRIGLDPFIDIRGIEPGEAWWVVIQQQIDDCDTFFALITHGTFESAVVRREIESALAGAKRIVPILHDGYTVADLEQSPFAQLTQHNLRELRADAPAEEILAFLESLRSLLGVRYRDRA